MEGRPDPGEIGDSPPGHCPAHRLGPRRQQRQLRVRSAEHGGFRGLNDDASEELFRRTEYDYTSVSATDESNYLYASRTDGTVEVYEFDGNNSPSWDLIATINTANYQDGSSNVQSNQVLAVGDYLYIANGSEGTLVLEINDGS